MKNNGFTLSEGLLALCVCAIVSGCLAMLMEGAVKLANRNASVQNELGVLQLRQTAAISDVVCQSEKLEIVRNHESFTFFFDRNRLVKTPGYEIYLEGIEGGRFVCEGQDIYLETDEGTWQVR